MAVDGWQGEHVLHGKQHTKVRLLDIPAISYADPLALKGRGYPSCEPETTQDLILRLAHLVNIDIVLRTGLKELNAELVC